MTDIGRSVAEHYTRGGLGETILAELERLGKDPDALTPEDLAPVDEFHVRGRAATESVAALAGIGPDDRVLDVGCGLGGPSRYLAAEFGCRVTGLDLTEEYCRTATMLAARTGLAERVAYRHGDALDLPFEDAAFDVVWTQHAAMNIGDKATLYGEMHRVLRPGGRLAVYDILAGPGGPPHFPVPWAREPSISFLVSPEALRGHLETAGFEIATWRDVTVAARDWFRAARSRMENEGPPPFGIHLLFGPAFAEMVRNQVRNLDEGRILLAEVVAHKP